ncbi:sensor histidine kinase [Hymenobacter psychrophilus]|uniref:histidine kinase n=1 Tax=Hymenobacter psychrophilus TaxID=651662 RepID=A0A1H3KN75_9BACT|nr:HAMP domain-containing sensor histidine kinase [Hymenobacter psychrophilus]SDY53627.1 two-component system, OmpR family, phosphate regulon sensor histidine kinase PhoR [Hymenobacter psychrophilus]
MRLNLSSRLIAVLLSGLVAVVLTALAFVAPSMSLEEGVLAAGITVAACFLLIYLLFEALIFREVNNIYEGLEHVKRKQFRRLSNKFLFRPEPLKRMRDEILEMAQRKQQEIDELRRLQELRREFLADVSHELKTPIFAAQGFVHTVLEEEEDAATGATSGMDAATRHKFLRKAAASLDALDQLVQDLVTISQLEKGVLRMRRQPFDLAQLVRDIFEQLELQAARRQVRLELRVILPAEAAGVAAQAAAVAGPVSVLADRGRIRQVLINLIDNGIKYGRAQGQVVVSLEASAKKVLVQVRDDGEGIPKQHQQRIFERFYRIDKSRARESRAAGGSGLGLAISKHIVEAHKSIIRVHSEPGAGTTLEFKLPRPKQRLVVSG